MRLSIAPRSALRVPRFAKSANRNPQSAIAVSRRGGFTLVELLVAVALIVLIMSMFAQVFRTASNLITRQRGMAENGQRARTLTTIIRSDISRRTFRNLVPFDKDETTSPTDDDTRRVTFITPKTI